MLVPAQILHQGPAPAVDDKWHGSDRGSKPSVLFENETESEAKNQDFAAVPTRRDG